MSTITVQDAVVNPAKTGKSPEPNWAWQVTRIINQLATLTAELRTDHATFKTLVDDLKTQVNRTIGASDNLITSPGLAIGSTNTAVASTAFSFRVNGVTYAKAAVATGTAPGNDVIPQGTYGAVALDIGADGTIDVIEAADNATGYASAALAIAGIAAVAADHVRMGTVTATKSDGDFTFGTTALDAANTTVAYTNGTTDTAVSSSSPATITAAATDDLTFRIQGTPS